MFAIFTKLELFSPFTMQVNEGGKQALELQGMRRIDEAKFLALKAANHKALIEKGLMGRVYAHFFSLANFARLYDRAVRQAPVKKTVRRGPKTSEYRARRGPRHVFRRTPRCCPTPRAGSDRDCAASPPSRPR